MKDNFIENLEALLKKEEEADAQTAAKEIKEFYDECRKVGFNEEQTMALVLMLLGGAVNG